VFFLVTGLRGAAYEVGGDDSLPLIAVDVPGIG
jgi:hypothetical protein